MNQASQDTQERFERAMSNMVAFIEGRPLKLFKSRSAVWLTHPAQALTKSCCPFLSQGAPGRLLSSGFKAAATPSAMR